MYISFSVSGDTQTFIKLTCQFSKQPLRSQFFIRLRFKRYDGYTLVHIKPGPHRLIVHIAAPIGLGVLFAADVQLVQVRRRQSVGAQPSMFVHAQRTGAGEQMVRPNFAAGVRRLIVGPGVFELLRHAFPFLARGLDKLGLPSGAHGEVAVAGRVYSFCTLEVLQKIEQLFVIIDRKRRFASAPLAGYGTDRRKQVVFFYCRQFMIVITVLVSVFGDH